MLLKSKYKTSLKQFFKGVVHEQPWYTIVWLVWGYTIVSSCFLRWFFFQAFPLPFPLLKFVSFYLASFFLESKSKAFQRSSFSQAKKTWMIMIHNSMVCLRVHYCVQLLPEVILFFNIFFTFSFAKVFSFIFLISFFYLELSEMLNFPKYIMPY